MCKELKKKLSFLEIKSNIGFEPGQGLLPQWIAHVEAINIQSQTQGDPHVISFDGFDH